MYSPALVAPGECPLPSCDVLYACTPLSYGVRLSACRLQRRHSFLMAGEAQSRQYDCSSQRKSDWKHDPHSDRLLALLGRFKPPLFDCFYSGKVKILVSCRTLDQDVLDSACVTYINFQQCRALEALSSRQLWVAGFDLIPAQRP